MGLGVCCPSPQTARHYSVQTVKAFTLCFHMPQKSKMRSCVIMPPKKETRGSPVVVSLVSKILGEFGFSGSSLRGQLEYSVGVRAEK